MVKKHTLLVLLLAGLALVATLGCSKGQSKAPTAEMTKTPRPTFTEAPPATATTVPSPVPLPTNTPATTPTPAATATATKPPATATPVPTNTPKPTATPVPPTQAPPPPTQTPAPQVGAHGVIGTLRLRANRTDYAVNEQVFFVFAVDNKTGKDIPFGILGMKADKNVPFKTSWTSDVYNHVFKANSVFSYDDNIVFTAPGTYTVKLAVCFSKFGDCQGPGADWEEFSPGVVVNIH